MNRERRLEAHREGVQHGAVGVVHVVAMPQLVGAAEGVLLLGRVELDMEVALLPRLPQHHEARVPDVGRLQAPLCAHSSASAPCNCLSCTCCKLFLVILSTIKLDSPYVGRLQAALCTVPTKWSACATQWSS